MINHDNINQVLTILEKTNKLIKLIQTQAYDNIEHKDKIIEGIIESIKCINEVLEVPTDDEWSQIFQELASDENMELLLTKYKNLQIPIYKLAENMDYCNICHNYVEYLPNSRVFQKQQKAHGFPFWDAVFESISLLKRDCPVCGSLDRERLMALFIDMLKPTGNDKLKVLQIAPSKALEQWLLEKNYIDYDSLDLYMQNVTYHLDIQNMNEISDETYDIIICSHVLEHIEDDLKAMEELKRILKSDGAILLLVPLIIGSSETDEEFGLSDDENWKRFGQNDHVRLYSKEKFINQLAKTNFMVYELKENYFNNEVYSSAGLSDIHSLYVATKCDIGIGVAPIKADGYDSDKLVSVIIPTFNRGYCIEKSITSVLQQTYENIELIIVDDGSTDNTEEIVLSIEDSRIRYIKVDGNKGANHARNLGIKESKGQYIAFNDSDDIWNLKKLEKQMKLMLSLDDSYGVVYSLFDKYKNNILVERGPNLESYGEQLIGNIYNFMLGTMFIAAPTLLIKKEVFENVGLFNEELKRLQDWELLLRIAQKYKFTLVQESLIDAHLQENSITHNNAGFIDTVLYALELHEMATKKIDTYVYLINVIVHMLKDINLSKEYKLKVLKRIEQQKIIKYNEIKKIKIDLKIDEYEESFRLNDIEKKLIDLEVMTVKNNAILNELMWAQIFNSSKGNIEWLTNPELPLWPGRFGVGYQYMYVVSRILNEVQPKMILETGLGQSTRLIGRYINWISNEKECLHTVIEHDHNWIETFKKDFLLNASTQIIQMDLQNIAIQLSPSEKTNTYVYQWFAEKLVGEKFDFISIDAPYGTNEKNGFSRIDLLGLLPDCLAERFCIVLDDYERYGEQNMVKQLRAILYNNNINFYEAIYPGQKNLLLIVSEDLKYLCTL